MRSFSPYDDRAFGAPACEGFEVVRRELVSGHGSAVCTRSCSPSAACPSQERGLVTSEWGESDTRRRAKFYRLTRLGKKQLQIEEANWRRIAVAMAHALESA